MAQKFSLKDNPIFQRLEVPKPKQVVEDLNVNIEKDLTSELEPSAAHNAEAFEGHKLTLKNRASKIDPQNDSLAQLGISKEDSQSLSGIEHQLSESETQITVQEVTVEQSGNTEGDKRVPASLTALSPDDPPKRNLPSIYEPISYSDDGGSNIDPQNLRVNISPSSSPIEKSGAAVDVSEDEHNQTRNVQPADGELKQKLVLNLEDHIEKSQFFSFYNEVTDGLLPTLNPAEQILYSRLFRLSYGFNRNYCTVSQQLLRERTGLSRNTVRIGLQSLVLQDWLQVVDAGNHVSTTYRVVLPREKGSGSKSDPQNQTLKIRPSKSEAQKLRIKSGGSKSDGGEGQKKGGQNLTLTRKINSYSNNNNILTPSGSKFDPHKLTPLHITNNSLALSEREARSDRSKDDVTVSAEQIVDDFYTLLSQRPATTKRQKSISECIDLLRDGFSLEQLQYAVQWTVAKLPETGSFSRVVHFIDQALKAYEEGEKVAEKQRTHEFSLDQRRLQEKQKEDEEKRIDEIRKSLPANEMEKLSIEATQMVAEEHGNLRFGRETLIQIKIRELIRLKHIVSVQSH